MGFFFVLEQTFVNSLESHGIMQTIVKKVISKAMRIVAMVSGVLKVVFFALTRDEAYTTHNVVTGTSRIF